MRPIIDAMKIDVTNAQELKDFEALINWHMWVTGDRRMKLSMLKYEGSKIGRVLKDEWPAVKEWFRNLGFNRL